MDTGKTMNIFRFSDKLFEHGHTWRECLEWWQEDRQAFLGRVNQQPLLPQTKACLDNFSQGTRFVIYFSNYGLDSQLSLPAIGANFERTTNIQTRYFCKEFYFPLLYKWFGRPAPCVALLDEIGHCVKTWGPRPSVIERQIAMSEELNGQELDAWLRDYDTTEYIEALDQSIQQCFSFSNES